MKLSIYEKLLCVSYVDVEIGEHLCKYTSGIHMK